MQLTVAWTCMEGESGALEGYEVKGKQQPRQEEKQEYKSRTFCASL